MSKVATAEVPTSQPAPATLRNFWNLSITGSLAGKLTGLDIMAQLPVQAFGNVNRVLGGVWSADDQNLYSMLSGRTDVVQKDGLPQQQLVTFVVIYEGGRYTFSNGVLSTDGTQITGGHIHQNSPGIDPPTFADDGTWSAQASPGGPGEPKPRGRTRRKRR